MALGLFELVQGDLVLPLQGLEDLSLRVVEGGEGCVPCMVDRSLQGGIDLLGRLDQGAGALSRGRP